MKHTLGPWRVGTPNQVLSTAGSVLAVTDYEPHIPEEETRANARLIAAGPDLLEALCWLVNTCCDVGKDGNPPTMNEHIEAIESGKAALAKAEGR